MRVLHLVSFYKPAWKLGGPVHSVSRLCEGLSQLGADVDVFTSDSAGFSGKLDVEVGKPSDVDGVRVTYLRTLGYWRFFYTPDLLSLLKKRVREFDIVHVTGSFTFFQLAWRITILRKTIPFVVSPRGSFMTNAMQRGVLKRLKKEAFLKVVESPVITLASAVHCVTEMERKAVEAHFPKASTFVVPNGLDISEFETLPARGRLRHRLGLSTDSFVFLYLGRLHAHKGLDLTIKAFASILHNGCNADLIVAGDPEFGSDKEWRDIARDERASEHVHFIGHVSGLDKRACFADADALILNSYSENFGISVAEALVSGLPVVISDQAGISDWVIENRAGIVVPQEISRIVEAMRLMVQSPEDFRINAQTAKFRAREEFNHRAVAKRMLGQYERILRGPPGGKPFCKRVFPLDPLSKNS